MSARPARRRGLTALAAAVGGAALLAMSALAPSPASAAAVTIGGTVKAGAPEHRLSVRPGDVHDVVVPAHVAAGAHVPAAQAGTSALTTFTKTFAYGGQTYSYRMVGTDPTLGAATTTTPVQIIPVKLVLWNGATETPNQGAVAGSALFKKASFTSGFTQYGDAIQRAEFWKYTKGKAYHSLLGTPTIAPQVVLNVPFFQGTTVTLNSGTTVLDVSLDWLDQQLQTLAAAVPAGVLPLFVTYDSVLYVGANSNNCCVLGYHSAITDGAGTHTYAYGTWLDPSVLGPQWSELVTDSHEISEWFNDPYTDNTVPNWSSPKGAQYGCSNILETGDPVAGTAFTAAVGTGPQLHYQDEVFLSWFTRTAPSIGIQGRYTYLGTFTSYAPTC